MLTEGIRARMRQERVGKVFLCMVCCGIA